MAITHGGTLPDTSDKSDFYALIDNATISGIVNAEISNSAAIADTKLATISTSGKVAITAIPIDTDGTLSANLDSKVPTQKATKTYGDTKISKTTAGEIAAMTEKTAIVSADNYIIEDSQATNAKKRVQAINILPSASVTTAKLKTSTGEVSASGSAYKTVLPGGEYGFYPQLKHSSGSAVSIVGILGRDANDQTITTSYVTYISLLTNGATLYAQQRYVTASGTDHWLFLLVDKTNLDIVQAYSAPDHPAYGNGGDFDELPHPFGELDTDKYFVCIADQESIKEVKKLVTPKRSLLTLVNEDYKVGTEDLEYIPLHSGKYLTEDNDGLEVQVKEMVESLPGNIKVRKLIKYE